MVCLNDFYPHQLSLPSSHGRTQYTPSYIHVSCVCVCVCVCVRDILITSLCSNLTDLIGLTLYKSCAGKHSCNELAKGSAIDVTFRWLYCLSLFPSIYPLSLSVPHHGWHGWAGCEVDIPDSAKHSHLLVAGPCCLCSTCFCIFTCMLIELVQTVLLSRYWERSWELLWWSC